MPEGLSSSMLKKLTGFLSRRKSTDITPAEAEKIQKAAYALSHAEIKKTYSPVYLSILNGLDSPEKQIFEATVYYLTKIAENKPKLRDDIVKIMNDKIEENKLNAEFKEILKYKVHNILSKNNR